MKGMFECVKGREEVEEACEERCDGEVTIVEVRMGNGTVEGGKVEEQTGGKVQILKTESVVKDVVEVE